MPFVIIEGERYALEIGETTLGGSGEEALPAPALASLAPVAVLSVMPDHRATISRVDPAAEVTLDEVGLDGEPRLLRHGTRITVSGHRLYYGDLRQSGSTARVAGVSDDQLAQLGALPGEPTVDTGGRLIALADGRAYDIPAQGIDLGRDPSCSIVLESKEVSRRHAVVAPGLVGYVVTDTSVNGVLVNGARIESARVLGRGDVIRIGAEEFRFEAEAASYEPAPDPGSTAAPSTATPAGDDSARAGRSDAPAAGENGRAPERSRASTLLATLEILNEGTLKGTRFRIERPVAHVGRGAHNDIVLSDDSVSGAHATLQRRRSGWLVVDAGSRNGTYVDGDRISGEHRLRGPCELRFGNIKTVFRPIGATGTGGESGSTRGIVGIPDDRRGNDDG